MSKVEASAPLDDSQEPSDIRLGQMGQDTKRVLVVDKGPNNLDQPLKKARRDSGSKPAQLASSGCAEPAVLQLEAAAVSARQELQVKQHELIHKEMQFLKGVHEDTKQLYSEYSHNAAPEIAQSLRVREQNAAIKILSAVDHLVDQSVNQATLPLLHAQLIASEKQPSSPANPTQVDFVPTQAPLTPSQPVTRQVPGALDSSSTQLTSSTSSRHASQRPNSHLTCPAGTSGQPKSLPASQGVRPTAASMPVSMPPVSLLLTRLTVLDVGQQMKLPDAELDRDTLAYVGNWARDMWIEQGKAELLQDEKNGTWGRLTFTDSGRMRPCENSMFKLWNRAFTVIAPEWSEEVMNSHHIRYSAAFGGASEIGLSKQDNTWTYPATARKLLENAFEQAKFNPRPKGGFHR